jgi:pimeloyl-ACP methyl ester carboxylesterase
MTSFLCLFLGIFITRLPVTAAFISQSLHWHECGEYECATIELPIDHFDKNSKSFHTELFKYPAKIQPAEKTIVLHMGGTGKQFVPYFGELFSVALNGRVDIIGFDPRGIGMSAVDCRDLTNGDDYLDELQNSGLFATNINPNDSQLAHYDSLIERFAHNCRLNDGDFLDFISTANIARDLDYIRIALGMEQLNLWAIEKGSVLGLTYANLFPENVGSFILESIPNIKSHFSHVLE